jgi:exodeoxyribonuclease VII small subunit
VSEPIPDAEVTFEAALSELEQIVRQLEEGNVGLSESLAHYEQGVKRLRDCYRLLEGAERRIELLERVDAEGQAITRRFLDEAAIERHMPKEAAEKDAPCAAPEPRAPRVSKTIKVSRPQGNDGEAPPGLF